MKYPIICLLALILFAGCGKRIGPDTIPPEYRLPLKIGLHAALVSATPVDSTKYRWLEREFNSSLQPEVLKELDSLVLRNTFSSSWQEWLRGRERDSINLLLRCSAVRIMSGSHIGKGIHNDYEEWQNLGYYRYGYVEGVVTATSFDIWTGPFASGVDAVNQFYKNPENRIIPITAALYLMNQKINRGVTDNVFEEKVNVFRRAAHTQAAQEIEIPN